MCACGRGAPGWKPDPGVCTNDDAHGSAGGHCACCHEPNNAERRLTASPLPAAHDTGLREAIARAMTEPTDWRGGSDGDYWLMRADRVLALPALRDLLAERAALAAQVQAVRNLHSRDVEGDCVACWADCRYCEGDHPWPCPTIRALGTPTTGGGE